MHTKSQFFQHSSLGLDDLVLEVDVILIQNHWKDGPKRDEKNDKVIVNHTFIEIQKIISYFEARTCLM